MVSQKVNNPLLILTGLTGSGKTRLALECATCFPELEIINADSLQVYKTLDIGTAKPTVEEQKQVPHHLLDYCFPDEDFNAAKFRKLALQAIEQIEASGKIPLIVGGTGFYLKALLFGMWQTPPNPKLKETLSTLSNEALVHLIQEKDPELLKKISSKDRYRLIRSLEILSLPSTQRSKLLNFQHDPIPSFLFILEPPISELMPKLKERAEAMLFQGWIEEVKMLVQKFPKSKALNATGYLQIHRYLKQESPPGRKIKAGLEGLIDEIQLANHQLTRAQKSWNYSQFIKNSKLTTLAGSDFKNLKKQLKDAIVKLNR